MFRKKQTNQSSIRSRRPTGTVNESFRRNNVVISKSQREMAQRQQSVTQRQADLKKATAHRQSRNRLIAIIVAVLLVGLLYRMNVTTVTLDTNASSRLKSDQATLYEASILKSYRANTLFGQSWLLDGSTFSADVRAEHSEIETVELHSKNPFTTSARADIRFRKPVFIWRDASQTDQFVDKNGVLFSKNLDPSVSTKKLIRIEDQSGVVLEAGSSVLTTQLVQFVGQLHSKVPGVYGQGSTVGKVIIPTSTREVQIQVSGQPYLIKFSSTRNLDEQVGELGQLLVYLKQNNITPSSYIDVRTAHKAFYK